jgi:EAL domain-containing protein (putative c-di-GMP-specific phosphodiesterase class I)
VRTLKIDRSFIRDLPRNTDDVTITLAVISMARSLGLTVVAEEGGNRRAVCVSKEQQLRSSAGVFLFSTPVGPRI